jgi:hypothetical protein
LTILVAGARAQTATPLGTVDLADAEVQTAAGVIAPVVSGRAKLAGSSTVTAKEGRNADVALARGGDVLVCQTSVLHATPSADSLLLALDRGAMEIRMKTTASDVVMTPDMRLSMATPQGAPAELDLRMRVTRNGDTCVENRGRKAPVLNITDAFGETSYQLKPGQHVMFEHGSLREVVDRETTPCGCPPLEKQGVSIAEAVVSGKKLTPQQAAAAQPFPAAVSEGLAAPSALAPETADGSPHVQVATTLTFDPSAQPPVAPSPAAASQPTPAPTAKGGPFRAIGHFFKHIFAR